MLNYDRHAAAKLDQEIHNIQMDVEAGVRDAIADNPDLMEDQVFSEIANGVLSCADYSAEAAAEFRRVNGLVAY